jgi:fumarate hydratase class II
MNDVTYRLERDSMGELRVPKDALWGAQTQRAVENFPISGWVMPRRFIQALGLIKAAAAKANESLGLLAPELAQGIVQAAMDVAEGKYDDQFPIDVFQTGSGTSSNMNANEVIAHLAARRLGHPVHPNDQVNMSQSSNDVIPSAIHVSAVLALKEELLPAVCELEATIVGKAQALDQVVKTGRTHLMDAMPVRMSQELGGWGNQIAACRVRIENTLPHLYQLAQGGTAVGTGINAHPRFAATFIKHLVDRTGIPFCNATDFFTALSSQDTALELSGALKVLAAALMKISNDLRWMNSGPFAGLGEIMLPALQPGSSIMPGKVNPVIPEAVCQVAAQVMGYDTTITVAAQSGSFQLNVMLPLIAKNLLDGIVLLSHSCELLGSRAIAGFAVNKERLASALAMNPMLVTALNTVIGYDKGAAIAKRAIAEGRPVVEVAREMANLPAEQLEQLLDPAALTMGGIPGHS